METGEKSFGKYVLLHKIAAGGMAVTYRARMAAAAGVTKEVVIKKIHPHLAEEEDFVFEFGEGCGDSGGFCATRSSCFGVSPGCCEGVCCSCR